MDFLRLFIKLQKQKEKDKFQSCREIESNRRFEFFGGIFMRKCIRCGSEMKENCAIKIKGAGYGIVMSSDENKLFGGRMGEPKVAICPACGEVSIYVEDLDKLK